MSGTRKNSWVKPAFHAIESQELHMSLPAKKSRTDTHLDHNQENRPSSSSSFSFAVANKATDVLSGANTSKMSSLLTANWMDIFTPRNTTELAVHAKKVEEVQEWLRQCDVLRRKHPAHICILTGPTGSGKTATIRSVAEANNYDIQEWVNPIDMETVGSRDGGKEVFTSRVDIFRSFLFRASRYKSVLSNCEKRLLLVEDFPNVFINDPSALMPILEDFMSYGKSPLVFVIADCKSKQLNISYNLFPDDVKAKLNIKHITFNAIAPTIMVKAMKRFCSIISQQQQRCDDIYTVPSPAIVNSIAVCAQGDIRNALTNLHFLSLKGTGTGMVLNELKAAATKGSKQKKQQQQYTLKSIGRDESTSMLHNLGRILNPKYDEDRKLMYSPESLVDQLSTEPKKMVNFIHANYCMHFSSIEDVAEAADGLSRAEVLLNDYRDDSLAILALHAAIRSVMMANSKPTSGWKPVKGPRRLVVKPIREQLERCGLPPNMSANLYASEFRTYIQCIKKSSPNA